MNSEQKTVLILGANSDVAKASFKMYLDKGFQIMAASRSTGQLEKFVVENQLPLKKIHICYFDAVDFDSHAGFYAGLPTRPQVVLFAAGYQIHQDEALENWAGTFQMMKVHYCGAVSILNLVVSDRANPKLERIVGLSSLAGVRGRKSNFMYGSTKSAFTQYLAGLRQHLADRGVKVNVIVAGYIRSKMTAGLDLRESLLLEPEFIARAVVGAGHKFRIVPGFKWKLIYHILRILPESLVAKLP